MQRFSQYPLTISSSPNIITKVNYLGDELWAAFGNFFKYCVSKPGLVEYFDEELPDYMVSASHKYFEEIKKLPAGMSPNPGLMTDYYFEIYTVIWNLSGKRNKALLFSVFDMVRKWEANNSFCLHKGTLFYFWATTDLIHGDYDEGIILMHKALEEDRRKDGISRTPDTPAHYFISMNDKPDAFLQVITQDMVGFIKRRLNIYNQSGGQLSYLDLRSKFLDSQDLKFEELKFYFCYNVLKWRRLRKIQKQRNIADDQMAPLIVTGLISDLLLVADGIFKISLSQTYKAYPRANIFFSDHLYEVSKVMAWTKATTFKDFYREKELEKVNDNLKNNFSVTVNNLLNSTVNLQKVSKLEADFMLCYGLRNYTAHTVSSQHMLWDEFINVLQSTLNIFFLSIEKL